MELIEFKTYCALVGLPTPNVIRSGTPIWEPPLSGDDLTLGNLLIAAMDKPVTDSAVIALRDYLGAGSQAWSDVVDYRKEIVAKQRGDLYNGRILGLVIDFLFSECSVVNINGNDCLVVDTTAMNKIKALRDTIEADVPY